MTVEKKIKITADYTYQYDIISVNLDDGTVAEIDVNLELADAIVKRQNLADNETDNVAYFIVVESTLSE